MIEMREIAMISKSIKEAETMNNEHTAQLKELIRYATLAPSSHNTQCWKFQLLAY
jgi:nitroreductase